MPPRRWALVIVLFTQQSLLDVRGVFRLVCPDQRGVEDGGTWEKVAS